MRKDGFDIVKAIAIWMVVIGHLYDSISDNDSVIIFIQFSHMPIFFFISGYFLWGSAQKYSLLEICLKKTKSLLVPYFVWSIVSFLANSVLIFVRDTGGYLEEFIGIMLYSRSVWFLIELYFSSILFVVIKNIACRCNINCYILWMLTWLILSVLLPDNLFAFYKFKWLFPFMIAGAFCAEKSKVCGENTRWEIASLIVFLLFSYILYDSSYFKAYSTFSYHSWDAIAGILYYTISLMGIIGAFALTHWKKPTILRQLFCAIGQSSMDIYVIHMFMIKFIPWEPFLPNIYFSYIYLAIYSGAIILFILLLRYKVLRCRLYNM